MAVDAIHVFSMKPCSSSSSSSSSSSLCSMKIKALLHTFILSHLCRIARALNKTTLLVFQLLKNIHYLHLIELFPLKKNKNNKQKKLFFGSFRLHYNWCSSHVIMPLSPLENYSHSHVYYDSSWNSVIPTSDYDEMQDSDDLSAYLQWLEEKSNKDSSINIEIDRLADLFIADCHEKFRLEKQDSYRRFQEMMATSI